MRSIRLALGLLALVGIAQGQTVVHEGAQLQGVMPLGADSILLQPAKERLNMLLSVESKEFESIIITGDGPTRKVMDLSGNPVRSYPRELQFRFTIGSRTTVEEPSPYHVETAVPADQFQSNLHFRLKVFHGVEARTFEPAQVKIVGVPADMPYDERIYRIVFTLPELPAEDRMMFEILDESGNRISKFHLQLL